MKDVPRRFYNMSDDVLIGEANAKRGFILRDIAEFAAYGVDAATITAFETMINAFEILPPDNTLEAAVVSASQLKNGLRDELATLLRAMRARAKAVFGDDSGNYMLFRSPNLSKDIDDSFLKNSRAVAIEAENLLTELSAAGLTQIMIDDLTAKNQEFEDAIFDRDKKVAERDMASRDRIKKGNEIYELLVKYCDYGKNIWYTVDESRYNDYIIYPNHPELPGKIENLSYEQTAGALTWDANADALTYEAQFAPDLPTPIFIQIYEGPATSFTYDPGGPDNYLFRVRGKNENGSGEWSDILTVVRI